ncbi:hypothetical protein [Arthrobacter sp. CJ23]|uniref:hypothetical protein n=1 Tax=Arthrobacter sp. CJ23 TaxID=2972479 RepID=UPI00215CF0A5|nr:hypothetical protein [Arthrobacter sp. CJ23]UVJ37993.1 hypothetical protein NVV90_12020 [Arthrobacter sp. CJ23]
MDPDTLKILIGAIAVITSGLGGQWLAGRNSRLSAEATHQRDKAKWANELRYKTYLNLIEQVEVSFALLSKAGRGDVEALGEAILSINSWKAPDLRLVGSKEVRSLANDLGAELRKWHWTLLSSELSAEEAEALRTENLDKFQGLVQRIRIEIAAV